MSVSKRVRYEVLRRDNHTCRYCHATDSPLTIDHVIPVVLGGSDDPSNLVAACKDCNAGKTSSHPDAPLVAQVSEDALRWRRAMQHAADLRQVEREERDEYVADIREVWDCSVPQYRESHPSYQWPADWEMGLANLYRAGLPKWEMEDAAYIAVTSTANISNRYTYMLGVARTKLQQQMELANRLISDGCA